MDALDTLASRLKACEEERAGAEWNEGYVIADLRAEEARVRELEEALRSLNSVHRQIDA